MRRACRDGHVPYPGRPAGLPCATVAGTRRLKVAKESVRRFKAALRQAFRAGRGRRVADVVRDLAPKLRGWLAYFRLSEVRGVFEALDQWLRRKLRALLWRQWKRWRTRIKALRRQGRAIAPAYPIPP